MSRGAKLILGVCSCLPFLFGLYVIVTKVILRLHFPSGDELKYSMITAVVCQLLLMIYYVVYILTDRKKTSDEKLPWILLIVFASDIAIIIYYFKYILPVPENARVNARL
jgi:Kef-type K+ transport system membrane component KefB